MRRYARHLIAAGLPWLLLWPAMALSAPKHAQHHAISQAAANRVYRVDNVTAEATAPGKLTITAHGAVRSGGWTNPELRADPDKRHDQAYLVFVFAANPPLPDAAVIEALIPVTATVTIPMPHSKATQIVVESATNGATADIPH